ncbi:MAG: hypothetical protein JNK58_01085 [Phycisphaerae bacterium]|nr:hypothetical protein [Phycisphaerae bacterium]
MESRQDKRGGGGFVSGVLLGLLALVCAWGALRSGSASIAGVVTREAPAVICRAELRSWVVIGRGRHLYLQVECPPPYESLSGRIEFTSVMIRDDYRYTRDTTGQPRVGRMRGGTIRPPEFAGPPDNRLEAVYELTLDQVRCLRRDRMFEAVYMLVGPNSNAAMRRVTSECGITLPAAVIGGSGLLGEFPGIDAEVGAEVDFSEWARFGVLRRGDDSD